MASRGFVIALTLAVCSSPAFSLELFGLCFTGDCDDQQLADSKLIDPKIYSVDLHVEPAEGDDVDKAVEAASVLWQGRARPVGGSAGLLSRAKGDYKRILAALYNSGFYGGSISIRVNGQEAARLKPGTSIPDVSSVEIRVTPGDLYRFGTFDIRNRAPPALDGEDVVNPPEPMTNFSGDPARASQIRLTSKVVIEEWRQQGHAKARIAGQQAKAIHPENKLNVLLEVDPGRKAVYGETVVEGAERVDEDFIVYMADLPQGREYDPDDLKKARKRLDRLDVFSSRKFREGDAVGADGNLPMGLIVSEKKARRIGVGGTLSSTEGAGVEAYWLHRNLFGRAERLRVDASVSGMGETTDPEDFDYKLGATFTKPGVFNPDTNWINKVEAKREVTETYRERSYGGSTVLNYMKSDRTTYNLGAFFEVAEFTDAFGNRNFTTAGLLGEVIRDDRDSKLDPTRGSFLRAEVKPFHEFNRGNSGIRAEAEARGYLALDSAAKTVLAGRVKVGTLAGIDRDEAPTDFLYFAGGGGSVRGYGYKNIGVIEPGGAVSGGRSLMETSVEIRHRINESFGVVGFVDAGIVGRDSAIDFSEDFRVSAGGGIRYYTSLGPIRLDVAVPLDQKSGDPDYGFFVGIGQAF